jgi:acetylornithine deacetylase/succinyl-diaminopimelate desuccinylase-like protein
VDIEVVDWEGPLEPAVASPAFEAMGAAVRSEDPAAVPVPFMVSGGTDAKAFATLGITNYGFAPLWLPEGFDLLSQFHANDERLPLIALETGVRMLEKFLRTY